MMTQFHHQDHPSRNIKRKLENWEAQKEKHQVYCLFICIRLRIKEVKVSLQLLG